MSATRMFSAHTVRLRPTRASAMAVPVVPPSRISVLAVPQLARDAAGDRLLGREIQPGAQRERRLEAAAARAGRAAVGAPEQTLALELGQIPPIVISETENRSLRSAIVS